MNNFYQSAFGITRIVGECGDLLMKPDYIKHRKKYSEWKKAENARNLIGESINNLAEGIWILGGTLKEIRIEK